MNNKYLLTGHQAQRYFNITKQYDSEVLYEEAFDYIRENFNVIGEVVWGSVNGLQGMYWEYQIDDFREPVNHTTEPDYSESLFKTPIEAKSALLDKLLDIISKPKEQVKEEAVTDERIYYEDDRNMQGLPRGGED